MTLRAANDRDFRAMLHRALELLVERAVGVVDRDVEACLPQRIGDLETIRAVAFHGRQDIDIGRGVVSHRHSFFLQRSMQHVDAARDANARHLRTAELFDEVVVATASSYRDIAALGELRIGQDAFHHRAGVVVETADERLVHLVFVTEPLERGRDLVEVLAVLRAEELVEGRCRRHEGAVLRVLRVEDAQRVGLETLPRFLRERVPVRREVGGQRLGDLRPALGVPDRVDLEPVASQPELPKEARGEIDDLDVCRRLLGSETLQTPLPELPVAKKLRPLPAKHRVGVEEAYGARRPMQTVLEERTGHGGGPLGSQRQPALAVQRNVVHLLSHDVAGLADTFHEDGAIFDDRRDNPRVAIAQRARLDHGLQRVEGGRFFGEQVPHSARGLKTRHGRTHDRPIEW